MKKKQNASTHTQILTNQQPHQPQQQQQTLLWHITLVFFNESHKNNKVSYNLKYISKWIRGNGFYFFVFNECMICIWKPKCANATHIIRTQSYIKMKRREDKIREEWEQIERKRQARNDPMARHIHSYTQSPKSTRRFPIFFSLSTSFFVFLFHY